MFTAEELSEEDQQLKNELDMLVERLTVSQPPKRIPINVPKLLTILLSAFRSRTSPSTSRRSRP